MLSLPRRYLFGPGFELSHLAVRCAIALTFLYCCDRLFYADYAAHLNAQNPQMYRPLGLLYLFGPTPPSAAFFSTCRAATIAGCFFVIVGLFTRLALLVAVLGCTLLASEAYAFLPFWSHAFSPLLLPALALLFGPPAPWSLDAVLRRLLRRPRPCYDGCRAAVLAAQLMVAGVFFNAAVYKLWLGNGKLLAWCFSDNLRNVLFLQYWVLHEPMPAPLRWAVEHSWAYQGMALFNIVAQLTPLLACFLVRRPILRFLCGVMFVFEVLGLGYLMHIWCPHWLLLLAVFIDWDRLARRLEGAPAPQPAAPIPLRAGGRIQVLWLTTLILAQCYVGFVHREQRRYTFPLTSFPMYSEILASRPYGRHQPWPLFGSRWQFETNLPLSQAEYDHLVWRSNYSMPWCMPDLHPLAMQLKTLLETKPGRVITGIRVDKAVYCIPPYPGSEVSLASSALAYHYAGGKHLSLRVDAGWDAASKRCFLTPCSVGLSKPSYRFVYHPGTFGPARDLPGEWKGNQFYFHYPQPGPILVDVWVRDPVLGDREVLFGGRGM